MSVCKPARRNGRPATTKRDAAHRIAARATGPGYRLGRSANAQQVELLSPDRRHTLDRTFADVARWHMATVSRVDAEGASAFTRSQA